MIFDRLLGYFSSDLAIDLGTANTLIYAKDRGIVVREPSVVAVQKESRGEKRVLAVGKEAKDMLGRTPGGIQAIRPMKDGVIADFEVTEAMLRYFILRAHQRKTFVHPRIIICVPYGITEVEKRAVRESAESAGAREVYLIEEPMAAAIGAGLPITQPSGNMIVDIGGGTTEVAVISLAGIVHSNSIRVGGDKMDEAVMLHMKTKYNMLIGERTAEQIKIRIGAVYEHKNIKTMKVRGRCMSEGLPKEITISSREMLEAMKDPISEIIEAICRVVEKTPPELIPDIINNGITMTGGGSLLAGLDRLLADVTGIRATVANDPVSCVVLGMGRSLSQLSDNSEG